MKALVWQGGQRIEYSEVPEPTPDAHEVVVDVELAGICGRICMRTKAILALAFRRWFSATRWSAPSMALPSSSIR